jgi:hypothetical protein
MRDLQSSCLQSFQFLQKTLSRHAWTKLKTSTLIKEAYTKILCIILVFYSFNDFVQLVAAIRDACPLKQRSMSKA